MEKSERIRQLMPLINQIKDEKLRTGVVETWVKAWEESEWEDVADCPFHVGLQDCSLIQHTNFVVTVAMAMASSARDTWHIPVDTDLLLAGAVLHDVCKVVEHSPEKGKPGKQSAIGENLVHGAYGVHLALNVGLPLSVAHLIGTHTPQVSQVPKVIEGIFICYADYAAADIFLLDKGMPLILNAIDVKLYR
ncbi:MAG: HDIG domain-containing protein [Dehalococcoidia bacterium]|jgi:putative nucleotidyltransferase with HDIG domain|nr:HDIG domain-containing protein [Dehalococcoidia bacterium]